VSWIELGEITFKLVWALALGAVVGLERERHARPAGLRTNMLVCMGAALITIAGRDLAGPAHDPARVAAQVVSGIGFLGAGTILRQGNVVRGLTTAAGLWVVAGIGIAVATGGVVMVAATIATVLAYLTLRVMARVEQQIVRGRQSLVVRWREGETSLVTLMESLARAGGEVRSITSVRRVPPDSAEARLQIEPRGARARTEVLQQLQQAPGVLEAYWE